MIENKPQPLDLEQVRKEVFKWIVGQPANELEEFFDFTMEEVEQRIKSACEFWLRYKDNPKLFSEEQFKIRWEYYSDLGYLVWNMNRKQWENYNEWLFKLAFKDVLGDD